MTPPRPERLCREALSLAPSDAGAHNLLGAIAGHRGDLAAAVESFRRATASEPNNPRYAFNLAEVQRLSGDLGAALEGYSRVIAIDAGFADAYRHGAQAADLAVRANAAGHTDTAAFARKRGSYYLSALALQFEAEGKLADAEGAYREAVALDPGNADALVNLGALLFAGARLAEAETALARAVDIAPGLSDAQTGLAIVQGRLGKTEAALASFRRGLALPGRSSAAFSQYVWTRQRIADWGGLDAEQEQVLEIVRGDQENVLPLLVLGMTDDESLQQRAAQRWARQFSLPAERRLTPASRPPGGKIRVGYLSADFREHPVMALIPEVFECYDRAGVETVGYSLRADDGSAIRRRIVAALGSFVDLAALDDESAARRIAADRIDILVDLTGYTDYARPRILAFRPALLQVNYLGYPGTMGADFLDYILVDPFVVPAGRQKFYDERLVLLPNCYQANDSKRPIDATTPSRAACGLPEIGFVFCCFNNTAKINPALFNVWMRLLHTVRGSVLWLLETSPHGTANLRREAATRGIAPERLVFALWAAPAAHLARHRLADLFLDTRPYNAHTTASARSTPACQC